MTTFPRKPRKYPSKPAVVTFQSGCPSTKDGQPCLIPDPKHLELHDGGPGNAEYVRRPWERDRGPCSVPGCPRPWRTNGMCTMHVARVARYGEPGDSHPIKAQPIRTWTPQQRMAKRTSAPTETGCWLWTGGLKSDGYGRIAIHGVRDTAHRWAWRLFNDAEIPAGQVVRHRCDIPSCVNPSHLELGTQADNIRDMFERGRANISRGSRSPNALVTEIDVAEIRQLWSLGVHALGLSESYGISRSQIDKITHYRAWKHVA